jgi:hypothetical protein
MTVQRWPPGLSSCSATTDAPRDSRRVTAARSESTKSRCILFLAAFSSGTFSKNQAGTARPESPRGPAAPDRAPGCTPPPPSSPRRPRPPARTPDPARHHHSPAACPPRPPILEPGNTSGLPGDPVGRHKAGILTVVLKATRSDPQVKGPGARLIHGLASQSEPASRAARPNPAAPARPPRGSNPSPGPPARTRNFHAPRPPPRRDGLSRPGTSYPWLASNFVRFAVVFECPIRDKSARIVNTLFWG